MKDTDYWNKNYRMKADDLTDQLEVTKNGGSDWSMIECSNDTIQLRSKEMAEQLHFMLGQMLGKD